MALRDDLVRLGLPDYMAQELGNCTTLTTDSAGNNAIGQISGSTSLQVSPLSFVRKQDRTDFITNGSLIQAPAWAPTSPYTVGTEVRLPGGQTILCYAAGTSGASAPTFSATTLMTGDGTVSWQWTGRLSRLQPNAEIPTIIVSATLATAAPGCTAFAWNNGSNGIQNTGNILFAGGISPIGYSNVFTGLDSFYNDGTTNTYGQSSVQGLRSVHQQFEFILDSAVVALGAWNSTNSPHFMVWVGDPDGKNMVKVEEMPTILVAGNPCWYGINWPTQRRRRYRVEMRNAGSTVTNVYGIAYPSTSSIVAPKVDGMRGLMIFDSYATTVDPGLANFNPEPEKLAGLALKYMGCRFVQAIQQASAGYVVGSTTMQGNATPVNIPTMLANNTFNNAQFDVVAFAPGLNDTPQSALVQAAALLSFQRARALWPNAIFLVFGLQDGPNNLGANAQATDTAIYNAVQQFGDSKTFFWSTLNDGPTPGIAAPWVKGTGKLGSITGDGNADYYIGLAGTHPPEWGHEYYAQRYGQAGHAILSSIGL